MVEPLTPVQAIPPLPAVRPVEVVAPGIQQTIQNQTPLAVLPPGTVIQGFVLTRDTNNNPILRTKYGDLPVQSDVFLKTGAQVALQVESSGNGQARILTVDGQSPQSYAAQNNRGLAHDTVAPLSYSPAQAQPQQAQAISALEPVQNTAYLTALLLTRAGQNTATNPAIASLLSSYIPPVVQKLAAGSAFQVALLDVQFPNPEELPQPAQLPAPQLPQNAAAPRTQPNVPTPPGTSAQQPGLPAFQPLASPPLNTNPIPPSLPNVTVQNVAPSSPTPLPISALPNPLPSPVTPTISANALPQTANATSAIPITPQPLANLGAPPLTNATNPGITTPIPVIAQNNSVAPTLFETNTAAPSLYDARQASAAYQQFAQPRSNAPFPTPPLTQTPPNEIVSASLPTTTPAAPTAATIAAQAAPNLPNPIAAPPLNNPTAPLTPVNNALPNLPASAILAAPTNPALAPLNALPISATQNPVLSTVVTPPTPTAPPPQLSIAPPLTGLQGVVIGHEADGATVLQSAAGVLKIYTPQPLPTNTVITLDIPADSEIIPAEDLPPIAIATREITPHSQEIPWVAEVQSALSNLSDTAAQAAAANIGTATRLPDNSPLHTLLMRLPNTGNGLTDGLLSFITSIKSGDIKQWIDKRTLDGITATMPKIAQQLTSDTAQMQQLWNHSPLDQWQGMLIPIVHNNQLSHAHLYVRDDESEAAKEAGTASGKRFLVEVNLSQLGGMQFDGFVRKEQGKQFDLVVRTQEPITPALAQDIRTIFDNTSQTTGFGGYLSFQHGPQHFVRPNVELKPASGLDLNTILA